MRRPGFGHGGCGRGGVLVGRRPRRARRRARRRRHRRRRRRRPRPWAGPARRRRPHPGRGRRRHRRPPRRRGPGRPDSPPRCGWRWPAPLGPPSTQAIVALGASGAVPRPGPQRTGRRPARLPGPAPARRPRPPSTVRRLAAAPAVDRMVIDHHHALRRGTARRRRSATGCVVVAPHPDDEVLGMAGLLRPPARRCSVPVCIVGGHRRRGVARPLHADHAGGAAHRGATTSGRRRWRPSGSPLIVVRLGLPDGAVAREQRSPGRRAGGPRSTTTTSVIAPWRHDGHPDHEATGARPPTRRPARPGRALWEVPIWAKVAAAAQGGRPPGRSSLVPQPGACERASSDAAACFRSQLVGLERRRRSTGRWSTRTSSRRCWTAGRRSCGPDPADGHPRRLLRGRLGARRRPVGARHPVVRDPQVRPHRGRPAPAALPTQLRARLRRRVPHPAARRALRGAPGHGAPPARGGGHRGALRRTCRRSRSCEGTHPGRLARRPLRPDRAVRGPLLPRRRRPRRRARSGSTALAGRRAATSWPSTTGPPSPSTRGPATRSTTGCAAARAGSVVLEIVDPRVPCWTVLRR